MVRAPCQACRERELRCHEHCRKYIEYRQAKEAEYMARKAYHESKNAKVWHEEPKTTTMMKMHIRKKRSEG